MSATWVGLEQYRRLFTDPDLSGPFLRALLNNLTFAVVVVPVQTGLALGLAILLNRKLKAIGLFRSLFFMPVVFPMALVAVIWRLILARSDQGMLNSALHAVSFGNWGAFDWLGDSATAMASIIVLSVWQGVGFQMVILLAGLQQIPGELYEAASSTARAAGSSSATSPARHPRHPRLRRHAHLGALLPGLRPGLRPRPGRRPQRGRHAAP